MRIVFALLLLLSALPAIAQDAPIPPDIREPTAEEKAKLDAGWRKIAFHDASVFPRNTIKAIEEIMPLVGATYGPGHVLTLRLQTMHGVALSRLGEFEQAEALLASNVSALEKRNGVDKGFTVNARWSRGSNLIQLGRLSEAAALYERNEQLAATQTAMAPLDRAAYALELAYLRRVQGRYADAERLARAGLEARLAAVPRDETGIAVARASLGRALTGLGRIDEATKLLEGGLLTHDKEDVGRARLLFALGEAMSENGRPVDAQKWYKAAADLALKVDGYDAPVTLQAAVRARIALLRLLGASPAMVASLVSDGLPIVTGIGKCTAPVTSLIALDHVRQQAATEFSAENRRGCLEKALAFVEKGFGAEAPITLEIAEELAATLDTMGDSEPALEASRRLLAARERVNGDDHPATARAALLYGRTLAAMGRNAEAKALLARASLIFPAQAYNIEARRLDTAGLHEAATAEWARAVEAYDAGPQQDLSLAIEIISGRVFNALYQGRCAEETRKDLTALVTAPSYILLGKVKLPADEAHAILLACEGKWAEADKIYQRLTVENVSNAIAFHDADLARLEARRALVFMKNRDTFETASFAARNATFYARERRYTPDRDANGKPLGLRREAASSGTDPLAITFAAMVAVDWAGKGRSVATADGPVVFDGGGDAFTAAQDFAQSQAAASLLQSAARAGVRDPELGALIDRQAAVATRIAEADRAQAIAGIKAGAAVDADRKQLAELTAELRRRFPAYANTARPFGLSISETRERLKPGQGLLLIQPVGDHVYSFALSANGFAWKRAALTRREVDRQVALVRCRIDAKSCRLNLPDTRLFDGPAAATLYKQLIAPVLPGLGDAKMLYTVTGGNLGRIPLGILVSGDAPGAGKDELAALARTRWLADDFALATLPSVSSLGAYIKAAPPASQLAFAGVGDPVLGPPGDGSRGGARPLPASVRGGGDLANIALLKTLESLPGTRRELTAIAASLGTPPGQLMMGPQAREGAIKAWPALREARIVAFATHAMLPGELEGAAEPGLVLTPPAAASAEDDGYLTASEAAALRLNAEWVLLSACNTAGPGDGSTSESLSGLARAFLFAGARSLLVSHWPVLDDAGAAITSETFRINAAKPELARAEAFRLALRGIRSGTSALDGAPIAGWKAAWADPWAWAPFSLIESGS